MSLPRILNFEAAFQEAGTLATTKRRAHHHGIQFNTRGLTRALGSLYERDEEERKRKCSFQDSKPGDSKWRQVEPIFDPSRTVEGYYISSTREHGSHEAEDMDMDTDVSEDSDEKENSTASKNEERKYKVSCKVKSKTPVVHAAAAVPKRLVPVPDISPTSSEEDDWGW